jgi:DNA-binding phage protein
VADSPVPPELRTWIQTQLTATRKALTFAERVEELHQENQTAWSLHLIESLAKITEAVQRAESLLTTYASTAKIAPVSDVARAAGITRNSIYKRAGSQSVQSAWEEVWPDQPPTRRAG